MSAVAEAGDRTLVSKGDYARMKGRAPSAVSNWIAEGKLGGAALVGAGRSARVWVEEADRQLADLLDVSQQVGQAKAPVASAGAPPNGDAARLAAARADVAELDLERQRAKLQAEQGLYMLTEDAIASWASEMAGLLREIELWIGQEAAEDAAAADHTQSALKAALRKSWRTFRERAAKQTGDQAAGLPSMMEGIDAP